MGAGQLRIHLFFIGSFLVQQFFHKARKLFIYFPIRLFSQSQTVVTPNQNQSINFAYLLSTLIETATVIKSITELELQLITSLCVLEYSFCDWRQEKVCSFISIAWAVEIIWQAATLVKGFDMHPSLQFCSFPFNCTLSMIPKNGKQQYMTASPLMRMRPYLSFYDFLWFRVASILCGRLLWDTVWRIHRHNAIGCS